MKNITYSLADDSNQSLFKRQLKQKNGPHNESVHYIGRVLSPCHYLNLSHSLSGLARDWVAAL